MPYALNDGKSISSFSAGIKKWTRKVQSRCDAITQEVNMKIATKIIMRSPVDTGLFRANWQVGIDHKPTGRLSSVDPTGATTIAKTIQQISGMKAGQRFFFANNLPYALMLEYGHSKQAPQGMVRLTINEFHSITNEAVAEAKRRVP